MDMDNTHTAFMLSKLARDCGRSGAQLVGELFADTAGFKLLEPAGSSLQVVQTTVVIHRAPDGTQRNYSNVKVLGTLKPPERGEVIL